MQINNAELLVRLGSIRLRCLSTIRTQKLRLDLVSVSRHVHSTAATQNCVGSLARRSRIASGFSALIGPRNRTHVDTGTQQPTLSHAQHGASNVRTPKQIERRACVSLSTISHRSGSTRTSGCGGFETRENGAKRAPQRNCCASSQLECRSRLHLASLAAIISYYFDLDSDSDLDRARD